MIRKKITTILLSTLIAVGSMAYVGQGVSAANANGWRLSGTTWKYSYNNKDMTGWLLYKSKWYYFDTNGNMSKGWIKYNNKMYFLNDTGDMQIGWVLQNGKWFYLSLDGSRFDNSWILYNSKWYYFGNTGEMAVSTTTPDGYIIGADGAWTGKSGNSTSDTTTVPQDLTANTVSSSTINLQWTKSDNVDYYYVYYSLDNKIFSALESSSTVKQKFQWSTGYSARLTGLAPGTKVYFKITSVKSGVESGYSAVVNATTTTGTIPVPQNLDAESISSTGIDLTWDAILGADYYNVYYRKSDATDYKVSKATKNSYSITGLTANTAYYIKIAAVKGGVESNYTSVVSKDTAVISAPIDVKAQATGSYSILLSWTKVTGADHYTVYYKGSSDDYYSTEDCTTNSFTLSDLASNTKVFFKVSAVNADGDESAISAVVNATTGIVPVDTPIGVKAQVVSSTSLDFSWTAVTGADYYYVYYRESSDSDYTKVKRTTNYFVLNDLYPETKVYFKVTAVDGGIESNYSSTTNATTKSE